MYAGGNFNAKDIAARWKLQKERMAREERAAQPYLHGGRDVRVALRRPMGP